jgi:hypothetical protein
MTQYLFMMIGRPAAPDAEDTVTKDYNAKWMAWIGDLAARGALRGGGPLEAAGKVVTREEVSRRRAPRSGRPRSSGPACPPAEHGKTPHEEGFSPSRVQTPAVLRMNVRLDATLA